MQKDNQVTSNAYVKFILSMKQRAGESTNMCVWVFNK